jgi:hypothetical protein
LVVFSILKRARTALHIGHSSLEGADFAPSLDDKDSRIHADTRREFAPQDEATARTAGEREQGKKKAELFTVQWGHG